MDARTSAYRIVPTETELNWTKIGRLDGCHSHILTKLENCVNRLSFPWEVCMNHNILILLLILPYTYFGLPLVLREMAHILGAENLHKKFARITQKNSQEICAIIPKMRKIADFRLQRFDRSKTIFYAHKNVFRRELSQVGAIGRDARHAVRTRQSRARGRKSASTSGGSGDGDGGDGEDLSLYLLDLEKLSEILCIEKQTLKNKLAKNPKDLPPPIYIPGFRGPRWQKSAVKKWLERFSGVRK